MFFSRALDLGGATGYRSRRHAREQPISSMGARTGWPAEAPLHGGWGGLRAPSDPGKARMALVIFSGNNPMDGGIGDAGWQGAAGVALREEGVSIGFI